MNNELSPPGVTSQVIEPRLLMRVNVLCLELSSIWDFLPRFKLSFAFYFVFKRRKRVKCTLLEAHYTLYCKTFNPNDLVKALAENHVAKPC